MSGRLTTSDRLTLIAEAKRVGDPAGGGERYLLWKLASALEEADAQAVDLERRAGWHGHILETYAISGVGDELKAVLDRAWDDMTQGGGV